MSLKGGCTASTERKHSYKQSSKATWFIFESLSYSSASIFGKWASRGVISRVTAVELKLSIFSCSCLIVDAYSVTYWFSSGSLGALFYLIKRSSEPIFALIVRLSSSTYCSCLSYCSSSCYYKRLTTASITVLDAERVNSVSVTS